jgi:hypothetical protein
MLLPPAAFGIAWQWVRWRRTDLWWQVVRGPRPAATKRVRSLKGGVDCNFRTSQPFLGTCVPRHQVVKMSQEITAQWGGVARHRRRR